MIMLEEGEIDEEDLFIHESDKIITKTASSSNLATAELDTVDTLKMNMSPKHTTSKSKRQKHKNSQKPNKRNKKSSSSKSDEVETMIVADEEGSAESGGGGGGEDKDERFVVGNGSSWSTPLPNGLGPIKLPVNILTFPRPPPPLSSNPTMTPMSLLELFKTNNPDVASSTNLVNPIITEKENKPKQLNGHNNNNNTSTNNIQPLFSNDLSSLMGLNTNSSTIMNKRLNTAGDFKRKILLNDPNESEMTVSIEDIERKMDKKRKYAEMFKEKQARELEKAQQPPKKFEPTVVCHFFLEGRCQKGDKCTFIHKAEPKKIELCKYYQGGYCAKADKCGFMHADFPCKFFHHLKKCLHGDKCRFSHEPIVDPLVRDAFDKYISQEATGNNNNNNAVTQALPLDVNVNGALKMTSLLGSPPHIHLPTVTVVPTPLPVQESTSTTSLPSLMNLAVKPSAVKKDIDPPHLPLLPPLPQQRLPLLNKPIESEFRDFDERISALSPPQLNLAGGDIDERSIPINVPPPITRPILPVAPPPIVVSIINKPPPQLPLPTLPLINTHETVKKELIGFIMKALAEDDGGIFSRMPKQSLTDLLLKILNSDETTFPTDMLNATLLSLQAAASTSKPPQQQQPMLSIHDDSLNVESSGDLSIDLMGGRKKHLNHQEHHHINNKLKINSDYEDDNDDEDDDDYDEKPMQISRIQPPQLSDLDLLIEGNVGEFAYRMIEIDVEPSNLWQRPPLDLSMNEAGAGDQECDPRIKYYSNRANCTNVSNFHQQLQQQQQQLNNSQQNSTVDATALSPTSQASQNGGTDGKNSKNRALDPRLVSRGGASNANQLSPTRSTSPPLPPQPNDLLSIQTKQLNGSSLLSSLPDLQFPKDVSRSFQLPASNSVLYQQQQQQQQQTESNTVKLSIQDYKRKLQKPANQQAQPQQQQQQQISQPSMGNTNNSISESILSSMNSLPSIPSYSMNLQAPQSLHELLRNLQS